VSSIAVDPMIQLAFSIAENKGTYALLLGSGLSRAAQIPTGWEITLDLIRRTAVMSGVTDEPDWAHWYRVTKGEEPNYSKLLEALASTPDERRGILHRYIEPDEEDRLAGRKIPTAAHHAIASLVQSGHVRVIVTTNFDRLLENSLRERGVEPTVVASADALYGAEPLVHTGCFILKVHGDYKDVRILNTDAELESYPDPYNRLLDRIFDEYGLVVCGWSGEWDHALRAALLRGTSRRYSTYWASRGAPKSRAADLIVHRRGKALEIVDADSFLKRLAAQVETLEQSRRLNPLSVDLLVNTVKRFLPRPEHRIDLHDLFGDEVTKLLTLLGGPQFGPIDPFGESEYRLRVRRLESATETLARISGAVGRWGAESEHYLMLDAIRTLDARAAEVRSGNTAWINLRFYPAVLVFYAYGIALTRSERWRELHSLCVAPVFRELNNEPSRLIDVLFLWGWPGGSDELWKMMEGYERRKTPLSDHLCDVMGGWSSSFASITPDFELLFERFEVLGSLAQFELNDEVSIRAVLETGNDFAFMPVGRTAWHNTTKAQILRDLQAEPQIKRLTEAGFAKSSAGFLALFLINFKRVSARIGW